jgi:hypothetical protein
MTTKSPLRASNRLYRARIGFRIKFPDYRIIDLQLTGRKFQGFCARGASFDTGVFTRQLKGMVFHVENVRKFATFVGFKNQNEIELRNIQVPVR